MEDSEADPHYVLVWQEPYPRPRISVISADNVQAHRKPLSTAKEVRLAKMAVGYKGDSFLFRTRIGPDDSVEERLHKAASESVHILKPDWLFHDHWDEHLECGGRYVAVCDSEEYREHFLIGYEAYLRQRKRQAQAASLYIKPIPKSIERLDSRLRNLIRVEEGGCWKWIGPQDSDGYGRVRIGVGTSTAAHRAVYEALCGEIPAQLLLRHHCHDRACVNPEHLTPGTAGENARDIMEAKRHPTQADQTSEYLRRKFSLEDVQGMRDAVADGAAEKEVARQYRTNVSTPSRDRPAALIPGCLLAHVYRNTT